MNKTIIIIGSVLLVAAIGTVVYFQVYKPSIESYDNILKTATVKINGKTHVVKLEKGMANSIGGYTITPVVTSSTGVVGPMVTGVSITKNGTIIATMTA